MNKKMMLIIALVIFSVSSSALAFEANGSLSVPAAPGVTKKQLAEVNDSLYKKIRKETDHLSVREAKTRKTLLEAIGNVSADVQTEVQSAMANIQKSAKESIDGATGELVSATKDLKDAVGDVKKSTELTATAVDKVGSSVKSAISGLGVLLGAIFILGIAVVCGLVIHSQRKILGKLNGGMVIPEIADIRDDVSEIKDSVDEIKKVVKPESYTEKFSVNGDNYDYQVPVDERGNFLSAFAPDVDPGDEPTNPAEILRKPYANKKDVLKSSKAAVKKWVEGTCTPIQKKLIDHLISTGELRKA
ncbi:MAG: hypothetical protein Q7U36_04885 [bacterium]|nr:hypothetical protein [bacterium]